MSRQMKVIGMSAIVFSKGASKTEPSRSSTMNTPAMIAVSGTVHHTSPGGSALSKPNGEPGEVVVLTRRRRVLDPFADRGRAVQCSQRGLEHYRVELPDEAPADAVLDAHRDRLQEQIRGIHRVSEYRIVG